MTEEANYINPNEVQLPQTRWETFFSRGKIKPEVLGKLKNIEPLILSPEGHMDLVTLEDALGYLKHTVEVYEDLHPPGFQYPGTEREAKQLQKVKEWLQKSEYAPLINYLLNQSVRRWGIADSADEMAATWTDEMREALKHAREVNERDATPEDPGFPQGMLEIGGEMYRKESQLLLFYAAALAKST